MIAPFSFLSSKVAGSLILNLNSANAIGFGQRVGAGVLAVTTTPPTTATPTGGQAPYTYAWTFVSGDGGISATAGTSATTRFTASAATPWTKSGIWKCRVTDSLAATADAFVNITLDGENDI